MRIYSDGWTNGTNPSWRGGGYVVMNEKQQLLAMIEVRADKRPTTNNETELKGVLKATELASDGDVIITDSTNTYWWVMKRRCKARPDLLPIAQEAYKNIIKKNLMLKQEQRELNIAGNYIEFTLKR